MSSQSGIKTPAWLIFLSINCRVMGKPHSSIEIGNMVFATRYESYEVYGKCTYAVYADPTFQAWQVKGTASGLSSWVRSNLARQLPI